MCMDGAMPTGELAGGGATSYGGGGMGFGTAFALSSAVSGITKTLASYKTASAQKQSLMLGAQVQQANADIIAQQMVDEKTLSKKERDTIRRKHKKLREGLAPATAANNLLLGGGSPLDALLSADIYATADRGAAKANEASRVYGLDVKKFNADAQGNILQATASRINPGFDAFSTLLSTSTSSAFKYYNYKHSKISGMSTVRSALGII